MTSTVLRLRPDCTVTRQRTAFVTNYYSLDIKSKQIRRNLPPRIHVPHEIAQAVEHRNMYDWWYTDGFVPFAKAVVNSVSQH